MPHLPDRHHDHDPALIAAFAAGDATGAEHASATELVATCTSCATLRDDLVAIATAVHELPAPRRTRDYRLTAEQAAALRPTGWRRVLGALAGPRFRLAAPLGTTMATLGVAGLLLTAMPGAMPFAAMGGPTSGGEGAGIERQNAAPAASAAPSMAAPAPSASAGSLASEESPYVVETQDLDGATDTSATGQQPDPGADGATGQDLLAVRAADETGAIVAGTLLLLGVALLALRWTARRLA